MSTTTFDTAIRQARDLLRWRSPLRTELWAARLTAELEASGQVEEFLRRSAKDGGQEARLGLAALAAVNGPVETSTPLIAVNDPAETDAPPGAVNDPAETDAPPGAVNDPAETDALLGVVNDLAEVDAPNQPYTAAGSGVAESLPGWARRMGQVSCENAWYGKADVYGEQVLAVLSFRYENGKEPHVLVVGIDQPSGGLAVDALVEEAKFLDELELREAEPQVVAGMILDAFELTDRVMGAQVADTLPGVRSFAIARARSVPRQDEALGRADTSVTGFDALPDLPGAGEAFGKLAEFVGDRPLWWSPARVSQFLTQWLPREAILSDEAIAAMPEVVRAWARHNGDQPAVLRRIDEEAPWLAALMADDSLASLNKRLAQAAAMPPQED
ncbi:hypothetical protein FXF51_13300 [Nonomuraea sp. PA05]|uniref:hypothetical protein n=1 Tax=Nonomuraea sp. PA05 TaxID=2604466 RepID=UPI0011D7F1C6|nr:hypothetical protein [Nonomuraea sp. PA05]TYB67747.1 hypothetical protein FXF51_13300 [Nonomuraea sp. PA05]